MIYCYFNNLFSRRKCHGTGNRILRQRRGLDRGSVRHLQSARKRMADRVGAQGTQVSRAPRHDHLHDHAQSRPRWEDARPEEGGDGLRRPERDGQGWQDRPRRQVLAPQAELILLPK